MSKKKTPKKEEKKMKSPVFKALCGKRNKVETPKKSKVKNRNSKSAKKNLRDSMGE